MPVDPRAKRRALMLRVLGALLLVLLIPATITAVVTDRGFWIPLMLLMIAGSAGCFAKARTLLGQDW